MKTFICLAAVLLCASAAILPGKCPEVKVKPTLDLTQYVGRWYEMESYSTFYEQGLSCSSSLYSPLPDGHIRVNNSGTVFDSNGHRVLTNKTGYAYVPSPSEPSKLLVKFDIPPPTSAGDYWVIDTDYTNFSIVWGCHNIAGGIAHSVFSWILSRTPSGFSNDISTQIQNALTNGGVDASLYNPMVQANCVNY